MAQHSGGSKDGKGRPSSGKPAGKSGYPKSGTGKPAGKSGYPKSGGKPTGAPGRTGSGRPSSGSREIGRAHV